MKIINKNNLNFLRKSTNTYKLTIRKKEREYPHKQSQKEKGVYNKMLSNNNRC